MELIEVAFIGPSLDPHSPALLDLPRDLADLLRQVNGFVQFGGGLHVRGICPSLPWHHLGTIFSGVSALHTMYPALSSSDVPFAQDCVADQFFLRDGSVWKLWSETGDVNPLDVSLASFLAAATQAPVDFLEMQPLLQFQQEGGALEPGQVLHVYPPFCTKESAKGVSLRAVGCDEALAFLSDFSRQLSGLPDETPIQIRVVP
jgi:hypothetical protein